VASSDKARPERAIDHAPARVASTVLDVVTTAGTDITNQADLFRGGRFGMGWSQTALARTILVEEEMLQEWESGVRPIPTEILAWVGLYARSYPGSSQEVDATMEDRRSHSPAV
jgi:ribosome-binding protein aMBF1 (putative translation factor)